LSLILEAFTKKKNRMLLEPDLVDCNISDSLRGKKVFIVLGWLKLGGAERQALLLARHLKERQGAQVEVWGFSDPERVSELCEEYGITCRSVPLLFYGRRMRLERSLVEFAWILRKAKPDIILSYTMLANIVCALTWRFSGALSFFWGQRDAGLSRWSRAYERLALSLTPRYIACSSAAQVFLLDGLRIDPRKVALVRHGLMLSEPKKERSQWRSELGLGEGDIAACMVANITQFKDHATLLRAWDIVVSTIGSDFAVPKLFLAGRLEETATDLKALAFDLGLNGHVQFLGQVNDVSGLLQAVDLCVFSSKSEASPNGILESMGSSLPVVATDIPGIRDAVGENYPFLAPVDDYQGFARLVIHFVKSPDLRRECGNRNRSRIEQIFSPSRMCVESTNLILQELCNADR